SAAPWPTAPHLSWLAAAGKSAAPVPPAPASTRPLQCLIVASSSLRLLESEPNYPPFCEPTSRRTDFPPTFETPAQLNWSSERRLAVEFRPLVHSPAERRGADLMEGLMDRSGARGAYLLPDVSLKPKLATN